MDTFLDAFLSSVRIYYMHIILNETIILSRLIQNNMTGKERYRV